jgi:hypothetical protein
MIDTRTFYIHYDGYPTGGAAYFAVALVYPNERDGLAGKFYRANETAEFTPGHDHHGDTEYRYTYRSSADDMKVERRNWGDDYQLAQYHRWSVVFSGSLLAFMRTYNKEQQWVEAFRAVLPMVEVERRARERFAEFEHQRNNGWTGNASSIFTSLERNLFGLDIPALIPAWEDAREWYFRVNPHARQRAQAIIRDVTQKLEQLHG